ncbi:MAG TPA: hypothetical protein VGL56_05700 [Fimbriimonadaceae bacterium]|jgi:hypothetical protein
MYAVVNLDINVSPRPSDSAQGLDFVCLTKTVLLAAKPNPSDLIPISERLPDKKILEKWAPTHRVPWTVGFVRVDSVHSSPNVDEVLVFTGFAWQAERN